MALVYLTLEQAVEIHRKTVEISGGGALGHLELGKLDSVLENIRNDDYYPSFEDKLTHLFFCACKFHCFQDGKELSQNNIYNIFFHDKLLSWNKSE